MTEDRLKKVVKALINANVELVNENERLWIANGELCAERDAADVLLGAAFRELEQLRDGRHQ
jgi:hypothetical protein